MDAATAGELAAAIGDVYGRAFSLAPYHSGPDAIARFVDDSFPRHRERPGFRCAVARDAGRVCGFTYACTGEPGQFWTDWVRERVPDAIGREWLGGHLELVELAVAPEAQGAGLGGALHDAILAGATHSRALLSARRDAPAAWGLYTRRGWTALAPLQGSFSLLGRRLARAPDAARR